MALRSHPLIALAALLWVSGALAATAANALVVTSPPLPVGWNLISVPLDPIDADPPAVFKDPSGDPIPISGNLYRYDHDAGGYVAYRSFDPSPFGTAKRGEGYWLHLGAPARICYDAHPISRLELHLATAGWYLIGTPKNSTVALQDIEVTNEAQARTVGLYDAIYAEGWLGGKLFWFDSANGYATCGFDAWADADHLEPWRGYWVCAQAADLCLMVPFDEVPPTGLITAYDGQFWLDGQPFRFVGANIRGMAHYGEGDLLPFSQSGDRQVNCAALRNEMQGRVARIFVASKLASTVEIGDRLRDTIAVAEAYDIYLLVCFTDMYNASQMHPMGDEVYYTVPGPGYAMLNHEFWSSGHTVNYLPLVRYLVNRFKDEPRIFAWELGNEIRDLSSTATFITSCQTIHDEIRAIDPWHMITVGVSRSMAGFSYSQAVDLYNDRFDFLVGHPYNGEDWEDDTGLAASLGKPFMVGEAGFNSDFYSDRPSQTDADIAKWIGRGARGYLQWGFMATSYDIGDGDWYFGVDHALHDDWIPYMQVYSYWGNLLSAP